MPVLGGGNGLSQRFGGLLVRYSGFEPSLVTQPAQRRVFVEGLPAALVDDAIHDHAATAPSLAAKSVLQVDGATSGHTATSPTVSIAAPSVTVSNGAHAHSATSPTLAAKSSVTTGTASHAHTATAPTLAAKSTVTVSAANDAHAATSPTLAAASVLTVASATSAHSSTSPSLAAKITAAVNAASHAVTSTSPGLTPSTLTVAVNDNIIGLIDTSPAIHETAAPRATARPPGRTASTQRRPVQEHQSRPVSRNVSRGTR